MQQQINFGEAITQLARMLQNGQYDDAAGGGGQCDKSLKNIKNFDPLLASRIHEQERIAHQNALAKQRAIVYLEVCAHFGSAAHVASITRRGHKSIYKWRARGIPTTPAHILSTQPDAPEHWTPAYLTCASFKVV